MIDKAMFVVVTLYALSFMLLAGQYVIADPYGITLRNAEGVEIRSATLDFINTGTVNTVSENIANATAQENSTLGAVENAFQLGYNIGKDLTQLMTGTYIFNLLLLLGVPEIVITGFVILYVFLLGRWMVAIIRGI